MPIDDHEIPDEALVALFKERGSKDDRPFATLYRRHQVAVWRLCYRYLGDAHDAEDLTQEVFLRVYRSLKDFQGRSSFKTWLHRVAVNTCQNEIRRRQRRPQLIGSAVEDLESLLADGSSPSPGQAAQPQERLQLSLERLRADERAVLELRELEGRSYDEIAQTLGVSLSAAKMRILRARLALQAALRAMEQEEVDLHDSP